MIEGELTRLLNSYEVPKDLRNGAGGGGSLIVVTHGYSIKVSNVKLEMESTND